MATFHPNIKFPELADLDVAGPVERSRYVQIAHDADGGENTVATALQLVNGVFYMDAGGDGLTDSTLTLPTAASLVTTFPGLKAGDNFTFTVINRDADDDTVVSIAGTGASAVGTISPVAGPAAQTYLVHMTDVSAGNEAYEVAQI